MQHDDEHPGALFQVKSYLIFLDYLKKLFHLPYVYAFSLCSVQHCLFPTGEIWYALLIVMASTFLGRSLCVCFAPQWF